MVTRHCFPKSLQAKEKETPAKCWIMKHCVANSLPIKIIPGLSVREPLLGDPGEVTIGWSLGAKASPSDNPTAAFQP